MWKVDIENFIHFDKWFFGKNWHPQQLLIDSTDFPLSTSCGTTSCYELFFFLRHFPGASILVKYCAECSWFCCVWFQRKYFTSPIPYLIFNANGITKICEEILKNSKFRRNMWYVWHAETLEWIQSYPIILFVWKTSYHRRWNVTSCNPLGLQIYQPLQKTSILVTHPSVWHSIMFGKTSCHRCTFFSTLYLTALTYGMWNMAILMLL